MRCFILFLFYIYGLVNLCFVALAVISVHLGVDGFLRFVAI